jgi:hypothetical protein
MSPTATPTFEMRDPRHIFNILDSAFLSWEKAE